MEPYIRFTREELKEILGEWMSGRELDRLPDVVLLPFDEKRLTDFNRYRSPKIK